VQATPVTDASECRHRIDATNLADAATIQAVDACRYTAAGEQAAREALAAGGSPDQLWAALWVYSTSANDPTPLVPFATNSDPSVRAMAAATLVAFGDRSGFGALEQLLDEPAQLRGSLPPIGVSTFSMNTLARYVVADGAPTVAPADTAALAGAWRTWLTTNGAALTYSVADVTWTLP
jgi:hypothetical protein